MRKLEREELSLCVQMGLIVKPISVPTVVKDEVILAGAGMLSLHLSITLCPTWNPRPCLRKATELPV